MRHSVATVGLTAARHEAPGAVIVWDESDPPTPCPTSLIAAGGIRIRELHSRSSVESLVYSPSGGVVVIGLDGSTASQAAPLIKRLSDKDFAVIVYLKRAEDLSVAGRCGLLLAGCSRVADAGSPGFAEDLARHVIDTLYAVAERSAEEQRLRHTMTALGFVGQSAAMLAVFRRIVQLGRLSDLPTLITGETGTGKELVGRALHAQDPKRRSGPFVALNCSALSLGVVESELFGHRRGAFTSADRDRRGLIRAAEGGVLFLDEVSELERSVQTKLLRVLQESRVRAVGEEDDAPVSVRVLAATNRDLRGMVDRQEFRADLFHRLNVLSIHLPPIRERRADVPLLAEHFVRKHSSVNPAASRQLHPDVIEALSSLELPGNVRQLENVVRWALVQNDGLAPLGLRDLPADVWQQLAEGQPPAAGSAAIARLGIDDVTGSSADYTTHLLAANGWSLSRSLQACERLILETALREAHGNHSHVARRLGITARSVYNMVRRHQLA